MLSLGAVLTMALLVWFWQYRGAAQDRFPGWMDQPVEFTEPTILTLTELCARLSGEGSAAITCDPRVAERRVFLAQVRASRKRVLEGAAAAVGGELRSVEAQWHVGLRGERRRPLNMDFAKGSQAHFLPFVVPFLERQAGTNGSLSGQPLSAWLSHKEVPLAAVPPAWRPQIDQAWPEKERPQDASGMLLVGLEIRLIHQERLKTVQANMERLAHGDPLLPMEQGPSSVGMTVY